MTPTSPADPFALDVLADPYPLHEALREAGPVVYLERYGVYAMARYREVREALRDWQGFQSSAGVGLSNFRYEKPWRPPSLLLEADPPYHDAPRHVLSSILQPRVLRHLRERWSAAATDLVDGLLDGTPPGGARDIDAVPALAQAYPLLVFPDAVGIGPDGRQRLLPYGDLLFNMFGPANELVAAAAPHAGELSTWVSAQCTREALAPGGFGAAIWQAADRGDITHDQAPLIVRSLLSAGVDTTVLGIQAVLAAFASHPAGWARLVADPGLARVAFDEAVRWASPVQTFFRTATSTVDIGAVTIPDGAKILMFLAAANRDPRRWDEPDAFSLDRDPSGHVGFGFGLHQCVGQHIARLEAECLLHALAARVTAIEPAGEPVPHLNNTLHGWDALPIRLRTR
ncbi:MAG TPA: cytochrome P450 [Rugosimonospora sp.]|nr:cytochrome P450 [Rugosimonospora sp.]